MMNTVYCQNRSEWRAWLDKNGASTPEIWVVYYKKDAGKQGVSYEDSVEEALCFGWIDGIIKKIDAQRCARRFTPRKPKS